MSSHKDFWVLTRARVIVEDGKEVIDHTQDTVVGGTFDINVAEMMAAILKERQDGSKTLMMSDIHPAPLAVLQMLEEPQARTILDDILDATMEKK